MAAQAEDLSMTSRMERRLNFVTRPSSGDNAKGSNGSMAADQPFWMRSFKLVSAKISQ